MSNHMQRASLIALSCLACVVGAPVQAEAPHVLVVIPQDYGANCHLTMDEFEHFGWRITTAGTAKIITPCRAFAGPLGCRPITVDCTLDEITDVSVFDAVVLLNTTRWRQNPCADLIASEQAMALIREAAAQDMVIGAMCVSVRALAAADVIAGVKLTGNPQFAAEYTAAGAEYLGPKRLPVIDGDFVTGVRGLCFNVENAFAIQTAIQRKKRGELAEMPTITASRIDCFSVMQAAFKAEHVAGRRFSIGGTESDVAHDACMAHDGAIVVAGATYSAGVGDADACVTVLEPDGTLRWAVSVGGPGADVAHAVTHADDGGFICVGSTFSMGGDDALGLIFKLDAHGELVWARTHGGESADVLNDVCAIGSGHYAAAGTTQSKGAGENDMWIVRFDGEGASITDFTYGTTESDAATAVCRHGDSGFVVVGTRNSDPPGNRDTFIARFTERDEPEFAHRHGTAIPQEFEQIAAIRAMSEGGFLIIGRQDHPDQRTGELMNVLALRVDDAGAVRWRKTYGVDSFYDFGCDVLPQDDGAALILGRRKNPETWEDDILLVAVDEAGAAQWMEQLTTPGDDHAAAIERDGAGRIVVVGDHQVTGRRDRNLQVFMLTARTTTDANRTADGKMSDRR